MKILFPFAKTKPVNKSLICKEDGFLIGNEKIKWSDIERIIAYKADQLTYDEIRIQLYFNNQVISLYDEMLGWEAWIAKTKFIFPSIQKDWDARIVHPPFTTNFIKLYEREDRILPEKNNFYASFEKINKNAVKVIFEQNGWLVQKASWTDFEIKNSWSDMILQGEETEPLLSGIVAYHKNNIAILEKLLNSLAGKYRYEFYDEADRLILNKE